MDLRHVPRCCEGSFVRCNMYVGADSLTADGMHRSPTTIQSTRDPGSQMHASSHWRLTTLPHHRTPPISATVFIIIFHVSLITSAWRSGISTFHVAVVGDYISKRQASLQESILRLARQKQRGTRFARVSDSPGPAQQGRWRLPL